MKLMVSLYDLDTSQDKADAGESLGESPHQEITVSQEKMRAEQNNQDPTLQFAARGPRPDIILHSTVTADTRPCAVGESIELF